VFKRIVFVTRFLSLWAVLLALPTNAAAQPTPLADLSPAAILFNSADLVPGRTVFFDSGKRPQDREPGLTDTSTSCLKANNPSKNRVFQQPARAQL